MFLYDHDICESSKRLRPHGPTENRRICNVVPCKAAKFLKVSFLPIEIWLPGDVSLDQKLSIGAGTEAHFIWYPRLWDLFTGVPCEELIATGDYSKPRKSFEYSSAEMPSSWASDYEQTLRQTRSFWEAGDLMNSSILLALCVIEFERIEFVCEAISPHTTAQGSFTTR